MAVVLRRVCASELGSEPPSDFRIFKAGANETTKGTFLFDEAAAASVMAHYSREGVDVMIDLEHMALDDPARARREDALDARGWFQLEMRGGELWAVNVRWTPDGARRLTERTQRYISPAFTTDEEGRIQRLINVALVAMPATHEAPALVAANKQTGALHTACYAALVLLLCARDTRRRSERTKHGS